MEHNIMEMNNDDPVYSGIVFKKKRMGISKQKIRNGVLLNPQLVVGNHQDYLQKPIFALSNSELMYLSGKHIVIHNIKNFNQSFIHRSSSERDIMSINYINENQFCKIALAIQGNSRINPQVEIYYYRVNHLDLLNHNHLPPLSQITHLAFTKNEDYLFTYASNKNLQRGIVSLWNLTDFTLKLTMEETEEIEGMDTYYSMKKGVYIIQEGQIKTLRYKKQQNKIIKQSIEFQIIKQPIQTQNYFAETDYQKMGVSENKQKLELDLKEQFKNPIRQYFYNSKADFIFLVFDDQINLYLNTTLIQEIQVEIPAEVLNQIENHKDFKISQICSLNNILLIGITTYPVILIYKFEQVKNFTYQNHILFDTKAQFHEIINFSISFDNSLIGFSFYRSQINSSDPDYDPLKEKCLELAYIDINILEAVNYSPNESLKLINEKGTPGKQILEIAICENQDYLGFLSSDRLVKILEYSAEDKEINATVLMRKGLSFDIHPNGIQCAIGFIEGLKIFFLTEGEFKEVFESFNKEVKCVKYSSRGDMLATCSGNSLIIYDPYTLQKLYHIQAHANQIKFMLWRGLDAVLITCSQNGSIYCWNSRTFQKNFEYFPNDKKQKIISLDYDAEYDLLVFGTEDMKLCMVNDKGNFEIFSYDIAPYCITSILIEKTFKILFAGTNDGTILTFIWPLQLQNNKISHFKFQLHQKAITNLRTTHNKEFLISTSKDCSIYMSQIKYYDETLFKKDDQLDKEFSEIDSNQEIKEQEVQFPEVYGDVTDLHLRDLKNDQLLSVNNFSLVNKEQVRKLKGDIKDLDFHIQNIKNETEDQNENLKQKQNEIKNKMENEKKTILREQKFKLASVMDDEEIKIKEMNNEENQQELQFTQNLQDLNKFHEQKLLELYKVNDDINLEFIKFTEEMEIQAAKLHQKYLEELNQKENTYFDQIQKAKQDYEKLLKEYRSKEHLNKETINMLEKEYNQDLNTKKDLLEQKLTSEVKKAEELKSLNIKLNKEKQKNREKCIQLDNLFEESSKQNDLLIKEIQQLQENTKIISRQLIQQEKQINMKEDILKNHREKNNYLQSNKNVYDFLVKQLEMEHSDLSQYFCDLSNNLKIVHKKLIQEAEQNKSLVYQKDYLLVVLKQMKKNICRKEQKFIAFTNIVQRTMKQLYMNLSDFSKTKDDIRNSFMEIMNLEGISNYSKNLLNNQDESTDNQSNLVKQENKDFKNELGRLKNVYKYNLEQTKSLYKKITKDRLQNYKEVQDYGKDLINKCTTLKNNRIVLYQKIYESKNSVDNVIKSVNLSKIIVKKTHKIKSKTQIIKELPLQTYIKKQKHIKPKSPKLDKIYNAEEILKEVKKFQQKQKDKINQFNNEN